MVRVVFKLLAQRKQVVVDYKLRYGILTKASCDLYRLDGVVLFVELHLKEIGLHLMDGQLLPEALWPS